MLFCGKCGVEISDNQFKNFNRTCPICLIESQPQKKKARKAKIKVKELLIFTGILVIIVIGISVIEDIELLIFLGKLVIILLGILVIIVIVIVIFIVAKMND